MGNQRYILGQLTVPNTQISCVLVACHWTTGLIPVLFRNLIIYVPGIYLSTYLFILYLSIYLSWDHCYDTCPVQKSDYICTRYPSIFLYIHLSIYMSWDHWIDTCPVQETDYICTRYPSYYLTIYLSIHLVIGPLD